MKKNTILLYHNGSHIIIGYLHYFLHHHYISFNFFRNATSTIIILEKLTQLLSPKKSTNQICNGLDRQFHLHGENY